MSASKKTSTKKKPDVVRIVIDEKLAVAIAEVQNEFPLLSKTEAVKVMLSKASQEPPKKTFSQILKSLPNRSNFIDIEDEDAQFSFIKKHFGV